MLEILVWDLLMQTTYFAVPVICTDDGKLLGVDMVTCLTEKGVKVLNPTHYIENLCDEVKRQLLHEQLREIRKHGEWFKENNLFCSLKIDYRTAELLQHDFFLELALSQLPFLRIKISERFPLLNLGIENPVLGALKKKGYAMWLDDLGAGNANVIALMDGCYDVVKLDGDFFKAEVSKHTFSILIKHIKQYTELIIVEDVDDKYGLPFLNELGISGVQGSLEKSVCFGNIVTLLKNKKSIS
ncbi:EAL domain-containing protein [Citrobacter arsenatis]|uniref:EAL domain-containing protein n=1 Tax=Citrobacter arsenatis TaxID=2546350 RepID=UPI003D7F2F4A